MSKSRPHIKEKYKVVNRYSTKTNKTLNDILNDKEFADLMYELMMKYTKSPKDKVGNN